MAAVHFVSDSDFSACVALLVLQEIAYGVRQDWPQRHLPGTVQEGTAAPGWSGEVQSRCWLVLDSGCTHTHTVIQHTGQTCSEMESLTVPPHRTCHEVTAFGVSSKSFLCV